MNNIFFSETNKDEKHTVNGLLNTCLFIVDEKGIVDIKELFELVQNEYDSKINYSAFKKLITSSFNTKKSMVISRSWTENNEYNLFFRDTNSHEYLTYESVLSECISIVSSRCPILIKELGSIIQANRTNNKLNVSAFKRLINDNFIVDKYSVTCIKPEAHSQLENCENNKVKRNDFELEVSNLLNNIDCENEDIPVADVVSSIDVLPESNNISKIGDLKNLTYDELLNLFNNNHSLLKATLEELQIPYYDSCVNGVSDCFRPLKDRTLTILLERNGYFINSGKTLEELGTTYNLTRERVRQIEAKGKKMINNHLPALITKLEYLSKKILKDKKFISTNEIISSFENDNCGYYYLLSMAALDGRYKYDQEYNIIYDIQKTNINELEDEIVDKLGNFISYSNYQQCSDLEKKAIEKLYTYNKSKEIYRLKGFHLSDLTDEIIYEHFPNGYRIYNQEDYDYFCMHYIKKFGQDTELPSIVSIRGLVSRNIFCQYDRGKVISRRRATQLDNNLIQQMLDYIMEFDEVVYYASIFDRFEKELLLNGVTNRYYMKGLLDPNLPENYLTKRDYICTSEVFISSNDSIRKEIEQFSGEFSITDLQAKYPGVKEYVFLVILYDRNDVIWLSGKNFILAKNLIISDELKKTLVDEIEFLFSYLQSNVVSSGKLFSRMMIMHDDLMRTIPIINNKYRLISLIDVLFQDKYYVVRQYITKDSNSEDITAYSLIEDYIKDKDIFSNADIKDYCEKNNIRGLYSFQEFMIDNSEDFIQIDIDTCVKKDLVRIDESKLIALEKEVDFYINSFGPINTETYNNYSRFPVINYQWNKYLLVGVIRCYFMDKYSIEYTDNMSTKTEYIIRRV